MTSNPFNIIMLSAWHEQGGNVTHRHFDGHPNLFVYPFESQLRTPFSTSIMDDFFVRERYRYPEFTTEMTAIDAYHAIWDEELKTYLRTPHKSKFKDCGLVMDEGERIDKFDWHCSRLTSDVPNRRDFVEAFFRSTFDAWENYNKTGKETHYVGYSPPIHFNADKFFKDFPNGQMVHVVRNPFSGYADSLKRPFPMGLSKYAMIWSFAQHYALTLAAKYPTKFHIVRYEDLIGDKKRIMMRLTEKLGIPYNDTLLYPSFNGKKLDVCYPWGTIETPTIEINLATAQTLNKEEGAQMRIECGQMIHAFDYSEFSDLFR